MITEFRRPKLMGILNVTPDSFSDGGRFLDPARAVERALEMEAQGAEIIDAGAESTRPGSLPVTPEEQIRRLLPVVKEIRRRSKIEISIDTQSAAVAEACLGEGASIINDISALRHDPEMVRVLSRASCSVILMHMQGTPQTMQQNPEYGDVVGEISVFFRDRLLFCSENGVLPSRVWLDPGIGFGKLQEHNLEILRELGGIKTFGRPVVLGVSRKSFLGKLTGEPVPEKRVLASVVAGVLGAINGADILRVHDVAEHAAALNVAEQISWQL